MRSQHCICQIWACCWSPSGLILAPFASSSQQTGTFEVWAAQQADESPHPGSPSSFYHACACGRSTNLMLCPSWLPPTKRASETPKPEDLHLVMCALSRISDSILLSISINLFREIFFFSFLSRRAFLMLGPKKSGLIELITCTARESCRKLSEIWPAGQQPPTRWRNLP